MIKIEIVDCQIKCTIGDELMIPIEHFPLKFKVLELITDNVIWEVNLEKNMWSTWSGKNAIRDVTAIVTTSQNIVLKKFEYNYENEDLLIYEFWDYFCRINKNTCGLILGCGDGTWGEWVIPVNREGINCHLVEGSKTTFEKLSKTYQNNKKMTLYNDVITVDGLDYNFYEGGFENGLNTINFDYLKKLDPNANSTFEIIKTESISNFLDKIGKVDWIRLDIEGSDYEIIKAIPKKYLESLIMIQYEHYLLSEDKKIEIDEILLPMGFKKIKNIYNIDTIYYR
jgi:hypothetical protein